MVSLYPISTHFIHSGKRQFLSGKECEEVEMNPVNIRVRGMSNFTMLSNNI